MRAVLATTVTAIAVLLLAATPAQTLSPAQPTIKGTWTGTLTQRMTPDFTVTATIRSFDRYTARNSVRYGAPLNCRGHWRFLSAKGSTYRFRETITSGDSASCKGSGTIVLRMKSGPERLEYRFTGGGVTSRGTLRRR